jgi:DNA-binding GntR family transcriptional regulator
MVEAHLARTVAERHDPRQLRRLRAIVAKEADLRDPPARPDPRAGRDAFHLALVEMAGNPVVTALYHAIQTTVSSCIREQVDTELDPDQPMAPPYKHDHRLLLRLIESSDGPRVEEVWRRHLSDGLERKRSLLASRSLA